MSHSHRLISWLACCCLVLIAFPVTAEDVSVGPLADLVAVEGDPLHDTGALRHPRVVLKEGKVVVDRRQAR